MSSREAVKRLEAAGFRVVRMGKGDHIILEKGPRRIVIPWGKPEMSYGMVRKVRSAVNQEKDSA